MDLVLHIKWQWRSCCTTWLGLFSIFTISKVQLTGRDFYFGYRYSLHPETKFFLRFVFIIIDYQT